MAIAASTLLSESRCFLCAGVSNAQALILALERRWLLDVDPDADATPEAILEYSKCYCSLNSSMFDKLQSGLLGMIAEGSGGGDDEEAIQDDELVSILTNEGEEIFTS